MFIGSTRPRSESGYLSRSNNTSPVHDRVNSVPLPLSINSTTADTDSVRRGKIFYFDLWLFIESSWKGAGILYWATWELASFVSS